MLLPGGPRWISFGQLIKDSEFCAAAGLACDDVIPLQERSDSVADEADLEECKTPSVTCSMSPAPVPATIFW
jgi:hypothetical protein